MPANWTQTLLPLFLHIVLVGIKYSTDKRAGRYMHDAVKEPGTDARRFGNAVRLFAEYQVSSWVLCVTSLSWNPSSLPCLPVLYADADTVSLSAMAESRGVVQIYISEVKATPPTSSFLNSTSYPDH